MIRFAKEEDRTQIARLVLIILKDMEAAVLQKLGDRQTCQLLEEAMLDSDYRYGLKRGLVYEIDQHVAGIAFGYPADDEVIIDRPMDRLMAAHGLSGEKFFTDSETFCGEWYLDTLCVAKSFRGHGIASQLLAASDQLAKKSGALKIGLCCDFANERAQRLYAKNGYKIVGKQILGSHPYHHMQKELD